jgi:tetratricopeptide (TPR) repeat protein
MIRSLPVIALLSVAATPSEASIWSRLDPPQVWFVFAGPSSGGTAQDRPLREAVALWTAGKSDDALQMIEWMICSRGSTKLFQSYVGCLAPAADQPHLQRAWLLAGELQIWHWPARALEAYKRVLESAPATSNFHAVALYQAGIASYRLGRSSDAAHYLDQLLGSSSPVARLLWRPAVDYLGLVFGDYTWDGQDTIDGIATQRPPRVERVPAKKRKIWIIRDDDGLVFQDAIANIDRFFKGRYEQRQVHEVYRAMAQVYYDSSRLNGCLALVRLADERWPGHPDAPRFHDLRIRALEDLRNSKEAAAARSEFLVRFGRGSIWAEKNRDQPFALEWVRKRALDLSQEPKAAPPPRLASLPSENLAQAVAHLPAPPWLRCATECGQTAWPALVKVSLAVDPDGMLRDGDPARSKGGFEDCLLRQLRGIKVQREGDGAMLRVQSYFVLLPDQ